MIVGQAWASSMHQLIKQFAEIPMQQDALADEDDNKIMVCT